jgi:diguanylate cyclase (GGDEF)-like protein/PAS domain S-box-containing protein
VLISVSTRRRGQARSNHAVAGGITALSPHSEILEALVRASPVAIIALDLGGRVQLWNPAAERLFGWAASDVTGRPYPLVPADRRDEFAALWERASKGEPLTDVEVRRQKKDGSPIDLSVFSAPLHDRQGGIIGTVAILADVTERRQAEDMRQRLAALVESSDDGIYETTLAGTILSWNAGAEKIYGYRRDEVVGRSISILAPPDRATEVPRILQRLTQGEPVNHFESVRVRKDRSLIDVSLAVSPIRDASGRVARASVIARDVTDRKRADKALFFLARLAAEFTTILSLPDLLEHILRVLREETGFDSCSLALVDSTNPEQLIVRAASGLREGFRNLIVPRAKGLHGAVMARGLPLLVPDMQADPRVFRRDPQVRSGIYAPLTVRDRQIGVLSAHRGVVGAFTQADLNLLTVVAKYLAGAIEVARLHEQIRDLAATDSLTGLANRRAFLDRVAGAISRCARKRQKLSVVLLDLDKFKDVNDVHGHAAGDQVLGCVAAALARMCRRSDLAARFGGDEFVLMLPETSRRQAEIILNRLRQIRVQLPELKGLDVTLSYCWGTAVFPTDGQDLEQLIHAADTRLYAMKRRLARDAS